MRFSSVIFTVSAIVISLTGTSLLSGCAAKRTTGWDGATGAITLSDEEQSRHMAEGMRHWKKRVERKELEAALKQFEKVARGNPTHYEALALLARGYYFLADGHIPDEEMEEKKRLWEIGTTWGERALATNAEFRKKVKDEGVSPQDAFHLLTKQQVDALYWTAVNLGKWARNSSMPTALKYKNRIKSSVERVEQLDPNFFYGAPDRYWGAYYSTLPALFGGSMDKSDQHFKKSLKVANSYLGTHVLYAEAYFKKKGDKKGFRRELDFVLKAKPESLPDIVPEQIIEQRKAKAMLAKIDELFD